MKLSACIASLDFAKELPAINNLLANAQGSFTFWGRRVITVAGYEGSISIDKLTQKVLQGGHQRSDSDDLTTVERVAGLDVENKLKTFYKVIDVQIEQANCFSRLLLKINTILKYVLSCCCFFYQSPRVQIERPITSIFYPSYFQGYSENRFIQEFGNVKNKTTGSYLNSDGNYGGCGSGRPRRIMADEAAIRAKAQVEKEMVS